MAKILNDPESAFDLALSHPATYAIATMRLQKLELSNTRTFALAGVRY